MVIASHAALQVSYLPHTPSRVLTKLSQVQVKLDDDDVHDQNQAQQL